MIDQGKRNVLGTLIDAVDYTAAVERIVECALGRRPMAVSAMAVHGVMTTVFDRMHRYRMNQFDLVVPDGQPVRWALNWLHGARLADRVYGPTLMLKTCARAAEAGLPIYLFGSTSEQLAALQGNLQRQFPRLQVAGKQASRFRCLDSEERSATIDSIRASGAAITFVGLGCPRQEVWAYELHDELSMPLIAVGAAFSFHAGALPQAPELMQRHGLEWLFRLVHEPRRLWRRYLFLNPLFASLLLMQRARLRRFDPSAAVPPTEVMSYG